MNVHPMFVHFPIALLLLYCFFEVVRIPFIRQAPWWFYIKAILVIAGSVASYPTIIFGIIAKTMYNGLPPVVVNTHETFGIITSVVFSFIALEYIIGWLRRDRNKIMTNIFGKMEPAITEGGGGIVLALIGGAFVSITGAFGGLLAYGPGNDPVSDILFTIMSRFFQ